MHSQPYMDAQPLACASLAHPQRINTVANDRRLKEVLENGKGAKTKNTKILKKTGQSVLDTFFQTLFSLMLTY